MNPIKISVVLPCYNEHEIVGRLLDDILVECDAISSSSDVIFEVIVVDDGSTDGTARALERHGKRITIVRHPYNLGNGAAVKRGILESKGEFVLLMDSDGQHPPQNIRPLVEAIAEYDMVVGSRTAMCNTAVHRNFGNYILRKTAEVLADRKIPDLTSGFRIVKRHLLLEYYHLLPEKYSYPTTITLALLRSGRFVRYYPFDNIQRREFGKSNIKPIRDAMRFFNTMLRITMLFNPQRIFMPMSIALFATGCICGLYQFIVTNAIRSASVILFISALFMLTVGLLADQLSQIRRETRWKGDSPNERDQ
jgi:glycosyltransferase involved in cell wall biosynthesis